MNQVVANFVKERETKNKVLFNETGSGHVGTLYISKSTLSQLGNPDTVKVTIEAV